MKARLAASIALAAALLVGTSACTLVSVNGTLKPYQPSDGAGATIGDIKVRNVLGLSEDGKDVALVLSLVNEGSTSETVTLQYTDGDGEKHDTEAFTVAAGKVVNIGHTADDQLVLRDADIVVGGRINVHFSLGTAGVAESIAVPVLDGTQLEYNDLLPGVPSPSPSATDTATRVESGEKTDDSTDVE